ncbi:MAG: hypothetical protein HQL50_02935 [Magnetococcales bacterium]|nr:hypothetical protein [Magnetococcales bacterium]
MLEHEKGRCWKCHQELGALEYGRDGSCSHCSSDTRCCRNCIHYDSSNYNGCRETQAERVLEKERRNFCDWFKPADRGKEDGEGDCRKKAQAEAEALFGGG